MDFYLKLWIDTNVSSVQEIFYAPTNYFSRISNSNKDFLVKLISKLEVYRTLCSFSSGKSPGPDGLNREFYRCFLKDIDNLLLDVVNHFFKTSPPPHSLGDTYVTLIRKNDNPTMASDFCPISIMCNISYKVISKLLANRLKFMLPNLVGGEQCGFITSSNPLDNILAVQEVAHSIEKDYKSAPKMILKIDFEKAYDTIKWNAILATLLRMDFPLKWISWAKAYLLFARFSFLVNGIPSSWTMSSRGIKQGDPLSPYLFVLTSQILTMILNKAMDLCLITGFVSRLILNFNHLIYADDLILVTKANRQFAMNCHLCLFLYARLTVQCPNPLKSTVYYPSLLNKRIVSHIISILCFKCGTFPFTYMGVMIAPKRLKINQFQHLVLRVANSLAS